MSINFASPRALVEWRTALRLTQLELASAIGKSRWSIVQYESGRVPIPKGVQALLRELNDEMRGTDTARRGVRRMA